MQPHAAATISVQRAAVIGGLVAVAAHHCLVMLALYRGRVVAHWSASDSDFIVFTLPAMVALIVYAILVRGLVKGIASRLGLAVLFTLLSAWAGFVVSFNTYGT